MTQIKLTDEIVSQGLWLRYVIIALLSLLFIFIIDWVTLDISQHPDYPLPDTRSYFSMVESGIVDNPDLIAPFAYRYGFTTIASLVIQLSGWSMYTTFRVMMYIFLIATSLLTFTLIRTITRDFRIAISILLVIGFAFFNVRYLIFDPIRPEPIAYCLLLICFLLIYKKRLMIAALIAIIGLSVREFMIAPLITINILYALGWYNTRDHHIVLKIIFINILISFMIIPPRIIIQFSENHAYLNSPQDLLLIWVEVLRLMNIFIAFTGQMLPVILLMSPARWQAIKNTRKELIIPLIPYAVSILILTVYGGTDLGRFISYLFIPQIILLAIMLKEDFKIWEIGYIVLVWFVYFRYWQDIPMERAAYLDFVGPYFNNITIFAAIRIFLLALSMIGMDRLRYMMRAKDHEKQ